MKNKAIELIALILIALTGLAGILTLPQVALLPQAYQPYVVIALAIVMAGKNVSYHILDFADNGKLDKSYRLPGEKIVIGMLCCTLLLPSCATNGAGESTFLSLTKTDWAGLGKDAGTAALRAGAQAGLQSYSERRSVTSAKQFIDVTR